MGAKDLTWVAVAIAFVPLLGSVVIFRMLRLRLAGRMAWSMGRMAVQLGLVGLYLTTLFQYNHPALTLGYILLMAAVANAAVLRNSGLSFRLYAATLPALLIALFSVLGFYVTLVFVPHPLYEARYLIPIAGMLLGNSMNRTIVTLERYYSSMRAHPDELAAYLTMGATVREASMPFLRSAYVAGIAPNLASFATMGLVSLPGMMTGQILGGSSPAVAIKYQIAIILAIFAATELATLLCVLFSQRRGFDNFGFLRDDVFKAP
jgi:putative ABC transport system permease protein